MTTQFSTPTQIINKKDCFYLFLCHQHLQKIFLVCRNTLTQSDFFIFSHDSLSHRVQIYVVTEKNKRRQRGFVWRDMTGRYVTLIKQIRFYIYMLLAAMVVVSLNTEWRLVSIIFKHFILLEMGNCTSNTTNTWLLSGWYWYFHNEVFLTYNGVQHYFLSSPQNCRCRILIIETSNRVFTNKRN